MSSQGQCGFGRQPERIIVGIAAIMAPSLFQGFEDVIARKSSSIDLDDRRLLNKTITNSATQSAAGGANGNSKWVVILV